MAEEEGLLLIGIRDKPNILVAPGSKLYPCVECTSDVWVAPAEQKMINEQHGKVMCLECFLKGGNILEIEPPTPEQLEQIAQVTGYRPTQKELMGIVINEYMRRYTPSGGT